MTTRSRDLYKSIVVKKVSEFRHVSWRCWVRTLAETIIIVTVNVNGSPSFFRVNSGDIASVSPRLPPSYCFPFPHVTLSFNVERSGIITHTNDYEDSRTKGRCNGVMKTRPTERYCYYVILILKRNRYFLVNDYLMDVKPGL
jgi:hypothetical protein